MRTLAGAIHKASPREDVSNLECAHEPRRCMVFGKRWVGCRKNNHFHKVCKNPTKRVLQEKSNRKNRTERVRHSIQQDSETLDQVFDVVRMKTFNFHMVRSVLITILKTKTNQNTAELDSIIDTSSDDTLMPINMFSKLFSRTPIAELKKYIHKEVTLHAYDNSSVPQLGVCRVTIKHKDV